MGINEAELAKNPDHPSGIPQDKIDNIMSGLCNTGTVKLNNHKKKLRQRFDLIKKLGQGTYGKVQLGINKDTGQEVAIKTIKKCKIEAEADLIRIRREVQIMSSVQHPNIIHIYEVFENREKMVLVMEFAAGGELYDYLSERKVLAEEEARRIFRQVATAVYYCHKHKICHRDLKLENILLDEHGNAKIADFGLSNVFEETKLLATFCGSPLYASPEIVKGTPYLGPEVDCWSLGVLLYTLVYGSMPFDGSNFKKLVKQISQGDYYEPKKPSRASPLIREMLTVCSQKRATIEQICNHWWVNEGYDESCLSLAENLANQTPVRLDVLLSLSPTSITADQLVVPCDMNKANEKIMRSHSVGSIQNIANTEAERKIIDMVAAGGEAALMPSPTHTITPVQSPVQTKRKLENAVSSEIVNKNKKQEAQEQQDKIAILNMPDVLMNLTEERREQEPLSAPALVDQQNLMQSEEVARQKTLTRLDSVKEITEDNEEMNPAKIIKKFVNKHKTADLVAAINNASPPEEIENAYTNSANKVVRKNSLPDQNLYNRFNNDRRNSRILEQAEKFQNQANNNQDKGKKIVIPGVSVSSFKKEFERRASLTNTPLGSEEKSERKQDRMQKQTSADEPQISPSESKSSRSSLEEAKRSMENSIALLAQAKNESNKELDQLCQKTRNVAVTDEETKRELKLKNAREIIGNAIQPGVRKPPVPFGTNGRSISNSILSPSSLVNRSGLRWPSEFTTNQTNFYNSGFRNKESPEIHQEPVVKTSKAEITLKSATLPRRKPTPKSEFQLEIQPKIEEQPMRFSTEFQHQLPDLRSAPVRANPMVYSPPILDTSNKRANSLGPMDKKEHVIPIQRPSAYTSFGLKSAGGLSRQSTNESDTETNLSLSQASTSTSQPIKKSPREFIIPIAVEGGGYITPKIENIEKSDPMRNAASFSRFGKSRNMGSLFSDLNSDKNTSFNKMRTLDEQEPFTFHRLRSSRPVRKISQENDSQSSGEEDDDDGFEILTAENLFSTLLQRVRALTNRVHANEGDKFPNSSRLFQNMSQTQNDFWGQDPFGSSITENVRSPWRHSLTRDLGSDMDSFLSRTGATATLPRGSKSLNKNRPEGLNKKLTPKKSKEAKLDLSDLDLSRLCLNKNDLEKLSFITPDLPKRFQEQLLAKLPSPQARKLSRTLSNQYDNSTKKKTDYNLNSDCPACLDNISSKSTTSNSENLPLKTKDKLNKLQINDSIELANRRSLSRINDKSVDKRSKSVCMPYNTEVNDKYKYYSPYLTENDKTRCKQICEDPACNNTNIKLKKKDQIAAIDGVKQVKTIKKISSSKQIQNTANNNINNNNNNNNNISINNNNSNINNNNPSQLPKSTDVNYKLEKILNDIKLDRNANNKIVITRTPLNNRRNKSLERMIDADEKDIIKRKRRSFSRSREKSLECSEKDELVKEILEALKILANRSNKKIAAEDNTTENTKLPIDETSNSNNSSIPMKVKKISDVRINYAPTNQVSDLDAKSIKAKSKIKRPKSYPTKQNPVENSNSVNNKSVEPPKEDLVEILTSKSSSQVPLQKTASTKLKAKTTKSAVEELKKSSDNLNLEKTPRIPVKTEKIKKIKSSSLKLKKVDEPQNSKDNETTAKQSSTKGLLYAIGQKFEKFKENTKSKTKKDTASDDVKLEKNILKNRDDSKTTPLISDENNRIKSPTNMKKSRIEEMVNILREKSLPRTSAITESNLIKKAVSVENIPKTSASANDKQGVNKVLNLFKRFEKEKPRNKTSMDKDDLANFPSNKNKSKSSCAVFFNNLKSDPGKSNGYNESQTYIPNSLVLDCPDCVKNNKSVDMHSSFNEIKESSAARIRKQREELSLNFNDITDSKFKRIKEGTEKYLTEKSNTDKDIMRNYSSSSNFLDLKYRSNSRSNFDDCSSSQCMSPTEDSELCFDNYSIYSDDTNIQSPTSRMSRTSDLSSDCEYKNESMIDRIRRRSYYTRFNEKKPRRQSTIVGPASKDYYRDIGIRSRYQTPDRTSFSTDAQHLNGSTTDTNLSSHKPIDFHTIDTKPPRYYRTPTDSLYKPRRKLSEFNIPASTPRSSNVDYSSSTFDTTTSPSYYSYSNSRLNNALNNIGPSYSTSLASNIAQNKYATVGRKSGYNLYEPRRNSLLSPTKSYRYSTFDILKKEKPLEHHRSSLENRSSTSMPKSSASPPNI